MSTHDDVRKASDRFYDALTRMANGDAGSMTDAWEHGPDATAMHPIGGREVGWDAVRNSFEQVAQLATDGKVELTDQRIRVLGDVVYEVGVEQGRFTFAGHDVQIEHRVTNIYQREGDTWKMIHHHTDVSPAMLEVLAQIQAG